jgi:hypothetical protein
MRTRIGVTLVALALTGGVSADSHAATALTSKSCARGTHAVISGAHKCLMRGQFCAHAQDRTYRRYGFRCTKTDYNGRYHLS